MSQEIHARDRQNIVSIMKRRVDRSANQFMVIDSQTELHLFYNLPKSFSGHILALPYTTICNVHLNPQRIQVTLQLPKSHLRAFIDLKNAN